jgi:hypothetical protein
MNYDSYAQAYIAMLTEEKVNATQRTQVATTSGTYEKTGKFLKDKLQPGSKIISIGAGLDHTKVALKAGLEDPSHIVHDMEPNPEGRKEPPEFTSAEQIPQNHYDAAVSHNVLNVVEPEVRDHVMKSIFDSVKDSSHVVIGTRKWKGDIDSAKNFTPGDEPKSMWVIRKAKGGATETSYQKGFDGNELKDYVESYAKTHGHDVEVTRIPGIAANGVYVSVKSKSRS